MQKHELCLLLLEPFLMREEREMMVLIQLK